MKLFYKPGACSLSPHIVLLECGLDFTLVRVDLANKQTELGEDFWQINPQGKVPALQLDDGTILTEGPAIVQYLADLKPDRQLLAAVNSLARYQTLSWLSFVSTELHKNFTPLFTPTAEASTIATARNLLEKQFSQVDRQLTDKQWIAGHRYTIADIYLFVVTRWAIATKLDIGQFNQLQSWFKRVAQRPAVMDALSAEGIA